METTLDINVVIQTTATLIGSLGIILAFIKSAEKFINRPKENREEMEKIKRKQGNVSKK